MRFGAEVRLAAWLQFNSKNGAILTLAHFRAVLGENERRNDHELFKGRFRELRRYDWQCQSNRDNSGLKPDEYKLIAKGKPILLGKSRFRPKMVSAKIRRQVFETDDHRCVICGVGEGETYPEDPGRKARLTVGHLLSDTLSDKNTADNLRTECTRCYQPIRKQVSRSEDSKEIWPKMRRLPVKDKARLLLWIERTQRVRDTVDILYDQYRCLPAPQREYLRSQLIHAVRGSAPVSDKKE